MIFSKNDRIVFLGDSVTDAGSVCPIGEGLGNNAGHGYVRMIDNLLASVYPELCVRVTNAGISGNDSRHLLARTERDCISLTPDWISVCIGINDVWRQFDAPSFTEQAVLPEEYEQHLSRILAMCRSGAGVKGIFLLTPFYIEPNREDPMRKRMDEYGAICARLAEKYGCTFIDLQALFEKYCQVRHSAFIAWDRVHPNEIGAMLIAREFLRHCDFDYNR